MVTINLSNDQHYNMVKLYDILRDMDMDLNDEQISAFENIQDAEVNT